MFAKLGLELISCIIFEALLTSNSHIAKLLGQVRFVSARADSGDVIQAVLFSSTV